MKRLLLTLTCLVLVAGCATSRPPSGPAPGGQMPSGERPPQQAPGQTRPLPRDQAPSSVENTTPSPSDSPSQSSSASAANQPAPPKSAAEVSSPAVMSLLSRADTLANGGHMDAAAATLERALGLDPRNPFIYQRLAAVRLADGQAGQAEQLAMKSNSVSNDNPFVAAGNWRLIAEARKSTGDANGAQAAMAQAVNYRDTASQYGQ